VLSLVPRPSILVLPIITFLLFISFFSFPQQPSWLDFDQRKAGYPDSEYFTGFGMANLIKEESKEENLKAVLM
jgi:hypothetical protein